MRTFDLGELRHGERQRWRNGDEWDPRATHIAVGELAEGWWYVRSYGPRRRDDETTGRAYTGERLARWVATCWMRLDGGTWVDAVTGQVAEPRDRPRAPIWG